MNNKALLQDAITLLREMVRTSSLSRQEEQVCRLISSSLDSWGIKHLVRRNNIIAVNKNYNPALKTLALDAHIDTVPANKGYTRDPFSPGDEKDIIYGLGSNDDGGSVVSMIAAFRHFYEAVGLPFNLMLVLSCEEECSGPNGARWLYGEGGYFELEGELPMPEWVIVGEPTGMKAAVSERGLLVIDAQAHGVSGHVARNEGVNALYIALDDINVLRQHRFSRYSELMGEVRMNVTMIQAGKVHNVVPESCDFVIDIRPTEQYTNAEILEELQGICKSTLKARNLSNRSSAVGPSSELLSRVKAMGIETFSSPTTSDWMLIRSDAIKMGPGDSTRSHKADEYIRVEEISEAIDIYISFIEHFYGNTVE